jgi:hypothetical protein
MKTPNFVTCPCQNCNGHIQFDPATLTGENNKTTCPHCSMETILFVPAPKTEPSPPKRTMLARLVKLMAHMAVVQAEAPPKSETPKPTTARLVPLEGEWPWCLEVKLDNAAGLVFGIGVFCAVIGFFIGVGFGALSSSDNAAYLAWTAVAGGVATFLVGYSISLIFNAAAEIIRLLKKQVGLPISGHFIFVCGECETLMINARQICPGCGAKLEK